MVKGWHVHSHAHGHAGRSTHEEGWVGRCSLYFVTGCSPQDTGGATKAASAEYQLPDYTEPEPTRWPRPPWLWGGCNLLCVRLKSNDHADAVRGYKFHPTLIMARRASLRRLGRLGTVALFSTATASPLESLRTPALVLHRDVLERNAERMRERAASLGCVLRPHFKTVKTLEGAAIATGGSRRRITVSTLAEAEFLADGGFDDILYAVPLTPDKVDDVLELHARLESITVMVDHAAQVNALLTACAGRIARDKPLRVVVGVDCGYHRDGCDPTDPSSIELVRALDESELTTFAGVYTHGGHSYDAPDVASVAAIAADERDATVGFAKTLRAAGVGVPSVGIGSTPTCSNPPAHLDGVDEMHPGNYLYYDTTQLALGSCTVEDIAVRVLTRTLARIKTCGHYDACSLYPRSCPACRRRGWPLPQVEHPPHRLRVDGCVRAGQGGGLRLYTYASRAADR